MNLKHPANNATPFNSDKVDVFEIVQPKALPTARVSDVIAPRIIDEKIGNRVELDGFLTTAAKMRLAFATLFGFGPYTPDVHVAYEVLSGATMYAGVRFNLSAIVED